MKNKNNLRKITAAVLALISVLSVMMLPSCANPPELSEIKPTIEVLIENSRKVNHMLFGEGLPIAYYEDNVFYQILAEELSRRDMGYADITPENYDEIMGRMTKYMQEFECSGVDRLVLED